MTDVSFKIGCKTAGALLALVVLGPVACRGAEPFSAGGGGFGLGSGGDLGLGGSGGAGGFGTLPVNTGGSGGAGTGGSSNGSGGSGSGGSTDAGVDVAMVRDGAVERVRDVSAPRDIMPEGPTTLINCYLYMPYKLDGAYDAGARVFSLRDLRVYQCKPWPFSGWCSQGAYEPGGATGYWPDAWMPIGYCE